MSIMTGRAPRRSLRAALLVIPTVAVVLFSAGQASANVPLTQVSTDPYTDAQAQHRTEVEPDTFSAGNTIVSAFQVGRVSGGGASNIGWAASTNGGSTWTITGGTVRSVGEPAATPAPAGTNRSLTVH